MGRISMQADSKEESMGNKGGNFSAAPRGIYTVQIADHSVDKKTTGGKNPGTPCTVFTCEIADQGEWFGKKLWHTVTWIARGSGEKANPGHGMAVHFLHAVGMPYDGALDFEESDFQGRSFRALLEVETYETVKDGKTYTNEKNVVRDLYTDNNPEPAELPAPRVNKAKVTSKVTPEKPLAELEEVPF